MALVRAPRRCKDVWHGCKRLARFIESGGSILMNGENPPQTSAEWKADNCLEVCKMARQEEQTAQEAGDG